MAIEYVSSPIATDAFSRRMLEAYVERPLYATGFMTLFAMSRPARFFTENDTTDIQIQRSGGVIAPMVTRGVAKSIGDNRKTGRDRGWTEISRVFPLVEKTSTLTSDQLTKRIMGEAVYSNLTRQGRSVVLAARKFEDDEDSVLMRCEYLASQSIEQGKQVSLDEQTGTDIEYDFLRHSDGLMTFDADWATSTTDVDDDLDSACDVVQVRGKAPAKLCLCGLNKYKEWQETDKFKEIANFRHKINLKAGFDDAVPSEIRRLVDAGFDYQFEWKTTKGRTLHVLTYDHTWTSLDGSTNTKYLDDDTVIVLPLPSRFRLDTCWGPPDHFDFDSEKVRLYMDIFGINVEAMGNTNAKFPKGFAAPGMYYDAYKTDNSGKGIEIRMQCAPIFCTTQTDAICTIKESWS